MADEKRLILKHCPFCGAELVGKEEIWRNPHTGLTKKQMVYSHPHRNCVLDFKSDYYGTSVALCHNCIEELRMKIPGKEVKENE